jgi:hypothetical protein
MQMNGNAEMLTAAKYWKEWSDPRMIVQVLDNPDLNQGPGSAYAAFASSGPNRSAMGGTIRFMSVLVKDGPEEGSVVSEPLKSLLAGVMPRTRR